ncbi:unnamed protein product [Peronospora belbahrii]|uniref:Uncharacterized protein n=1 Tax=Peronospora belbahrii TaxID=622444 RepID=A0AAU9KLW6_9STRA|nr:unnamed protein product [Peronospora belbahrii]CAH0520808.1 unnamed protein product [Peronospora belbahrii]
MQKCSSTSSDAPLLDCIERALRMYFSSKLSVQDAEDPVQFRTQMLHHDDENGNERADEGDDGRSLTVHQVFVGMLDAMYVTQLAVILKVWNETSVNPLLALATTTEAAESPMLTMKA